MVTAGQRSVSKSKLARKVILAIVALILVGVLFDLLMDSIVHSRKEVMVPDFKGKSLGDALAMTSSMNLGIKKEGDEYAQNLPAGTIIRQSPLPGMTVKEGKIIKVTLSRGGEVLFVPELTGQPVRTAEIAIRQAGLALGEESTRFSLKIEKGNVISQDPQAGAITDKDSIVSIVISAGRPPEGTLLVPDFAGKNIDEASAWASSNKISLDIAEEKSTVSGPGAVLRQNPPPDQEVQVGGSVSVVVASGQSSGSTPAIGRNFRYDIPQGGDMRKVRITMLDDSGETEIFKGERAPGTKIELPINARGAARARIYLNGILVEETDIK
jgi:beta-lactam-binding protein with PASTA domain